MLNGFRVQDTKVFLLRSLGFKLKVQSLGSFYKGSYRGLGLA